MDKSTFAREVQNFLARNDPERGKDISMDTNLFEAGYLDSLTFLSLIFFLEENLRRTISLSGFRKNSFTTINTMYVALFPEQH